MRIAVAVSTLVLGVLSGMAIGLWVGAQSPRHFIGIHCGVTQVSRYEVRVDSLNDCEAKAEISNR